uniref:ANF_receptor domain-containing protein n=1 Tax=Globodera pallida TaxID=36090 RepID=A0A183CN02_GLOPA
MNTILTIARTFSRSTTARVGIPFVVDNDGKTGGSVFFNMTNQRTLSERVYDIYSRLLKDRIVCVMNPIDDYFAAAVIAQLLFLQSESGKTPINM